MTIPRQPSSASARRTDRPRAPGAPYGLLLIFAALFLLYALTASRGIQWQDAGFHIVRMMRGELVNPLGLALSHPLHFWLGRAALTLSFLEPAYAVTLISALAGAVAVACVFGCVRTLTGKPLASVVAACSLGLANTFWQMATLAECNTLTAALLAAELWSVVVFFTGKRRVGLILAFLFNGLGIANHMQAALTTPLLLIVLVDAMRRRRVAQRTAIAAAALWLLGSLPYVGLVVVTAIDTGDWTGTVRSALFGHAYADAVMNLLPSWQQLAIVVGFILLNFPNLTLPLFVRGWFRRVSAPPDGAVHRYLVAAWIIHFLFAVRYRVVDQHTFFLPTYVFTAVLAGAGFAAMLGASSAHRRKRVYTVIALLCTTPLVYALVPPLARRAGVLRHVAHEKPYRDDYVYLFIPWTVAERSAERVGREAIALAGDDGVVIVEDSMARPAVEYERLRRNKPKIEIILRSSKGRVDPAAVARALAERRTIVLVPLDRDHPAVVIPGRSWQRRGDLYVLAPD